MNILHMKYALEVARAGSLSKASKVLLVATPNISRSMKELESDLGIKIFVRTTKGVKLTPEGEEFIGFAQRILGEIEAQEQFYKNDLPKVQKFSLSAPGASYIADAFAIFTGTLEKSTAEVFYAEANTHRTIQDIANDTYNLGIIRYESGSDRYYKEMLDGSGITYELIEEFPYSLIMSDQSPMAAAENITVDDLRGYIEIVKADSAMPPLPFAAGEGSEMPVCANRCIYLGGRAGEYELLSTNHDTFMWASPAPRRILDRFGLVMRKCSGVNKTYRDLLIYKRGYVMTPLDRQFVTNLCESKRRVFLQS